MREPVGDVDGGDVFYDLHGAQISCIKIFDSVREACQRLVDVLVGLLFNFHEIKLVDGITRPVLSVIRGKRSAAWQQSTAPLFCNKISAELRFQFTLILYRPACAVSAEPWASMRFIQDG